jgi:SPP1 family predicted phage head-tail adaptor
MAREPGRMGRYNRRVTIEVMTTAADGSGGQTESWATFGRAWVEATATAGGERLEAGAMQASQNWRIETHWRSDVTTSHRLAADWLPANHRIFLDRVFDPNGDRQMLVMFGTAMLAFDQAAS